MKRRKITTHWSIIRMLKLACLSMLLIWPTYSFQLPSVPSCKWVLNKTCSLKVNGSTTINSFSCIIPQYLNPDTLMVNNSQNPVKLSGTMALAIAQFDCHNPMMTAGLRKTLQAKDFPKILIRFISLDHYPDAFNREAQVKGNVNIQLAGTVKNYEINYTYLQDRNGNLRLIGTQSLRFSDFNLIPPRKLGGMIKTNDLLSVEFILNLNILNELK